MTTVVDDHVSIHLRELLLERFTPDQLQHVVASMRARGHVPGPVAGQLADELAEILSSAPMESDEGPIYNRPTIGWHRRKAERIAEARK